MDQLRVSGGWVRCGHCAEVFDASANLQSLPESPLVAAASMAQPPIPVPPADQLIPAPTHEPSALGLQRPAKSWIDAPGRSSSTTASAAEVTAAESLPDVAPGKRPQAWRPTESFGDKFLGVGVERDSSSDDGYKSDFDAAALKQKTSADLVHEAEIPRNDSGIPSVAAGGTDAVIDHKDAESGYSISKLPAEAGALEEPGDVSFVREAIRKKFWRKPVTRIVLGLLVLVLAMVLLLQVVLYQRDTIAALEPRFKPALQAICVEMRCELGPLKRIEVLVIESSSFSRVNADSYRLSFIIKNNGAVAVAMPSLEVTLTDTQEKPVLRRVISPTQFGAVSAVLPAESDFAGLVAFELPDSEAGGSAASGGPLRVAGYRVLAFYP